MREHAKHFEDEIAGAAGKEAAKSRSFGAPIGRTPVDNISHLSSLEVMVIRKQIGRTHIQDL